MTLRLKDGRTNNDGVEFRRIRPRSTMKRWTAKLMSFFLAGAMTFAATNINQKGVRNAMADPIVLSDLDRTVLQERASQAVVAFRNYMLTGNEQYRTEFLRLYNGRYPSGNPNASRAFELSDFSRHFDSELDSLVYNHPNYTHIRDLRNQLQSHIRPPMDAVQFMDAVYAVRTRYARGRADASAIAALVTNVEQAQGTTPRAGSAIERVRRIMSEDSSISIQEAARTALEYQMRTQLEAEFGEEFVGALIESMPVERGRRAAWMVVDGMLNGDVRVIEEARRMMSEEGNDSETFRQAFEEGLNARLEHGTEPGIDAFNEILQLCRNARGEEFRYGEFVDMLANIYSAATGRANVQQWMALQHDYDIITNEGTSDERRIEITRRVVEAFAQGMARTAFRLLTDVATTGNPTSRDEFIRLINRRYIQSIPGTGYDTVTYDNLLINGTFSREFWGLNDQEAQSRSTSLGRFTRLYRGQVLAVALRQLYIELGGRNPNMDVLRRVYDPFTGTNTGPQLVDFVATNMNNLSWLLRDPASVLEVARARAAEGDETAAAYLRMQPRPDGQVLINLYRELVALRAAERTISANPMEFMRQRSDDTDFENVTIIPRLAPGQQPTEEQILALQRAILQQPYSQDTNGSIANGLFDILAVPETSVAGARRTTPPTRTISLETCRDIILAYNHVLHRNEVEERLNAAHGDDALHFVRNNLDQLYWLVRPVEEVNAMLEQRMNEPEMVEMRRILTYQNAYSSGSLSIALHDIYLATGRTLSEQERARLDNLYGRDLVQYCIDNREQLAMLANSPEQIAADISNGGNEQEGHLSQNAVTVFRSYLYTYTMEGLARTMVSAYSALQTGGVSSANATDELGQRLLDILVPRIRQARISRRTTTNSDILTNQSAIMRNCQELEERLRRPMLAPVRAMLEHRLQEWRARALRIQLDSEDIPTGDRNAEARILRLQRGLQNEMISADDLDNAIEMSFLASYITRTGGVNTRDSSRWTQLTSMYDELPPERQAIFGELVSTLVRSTNEEFHAFVMTTGENNYYEALVEVYEMVISEQDGSGARRTRTNLVERYGESFVRMVEAQAPHLRFLQGVEEAEIPNAMECAHVGEENELFANILIRCYRALRTPEAGETRTQMIELYGEEFVSVVQELIDDPDHASALSVLERSECSLADVRALPEEVRLRLLVGRTPEDSVSPYQLAYRHSVLGGLRRSFRRQDENLVMVLGDFYPALRNAPGRDAATQAREEYARTLQRLVDQYGLEFTQFMVDHAEEIVAHYTSTPVRTEEVDEQADSETPSDRVSTTGRRIALTDAIRLSDLPPELLEELYSAYEHSPVAANTNFIDNLRYTEREAREVYLFLRQSLSPDNLLSESYDASDGNELPEEYEALLARYARSFGDNPYLFTQYFNLDALNSQLSRLEEESGYRMPEGLTTISTPRELFRFLNSQLGRYLVSSGRRFLEDMESQYILDTQEMNIDELDEQSQERFEIYGQDAIDRLRQNLTIVDIILMGTVAPEVASSDSVFGARSSTALMHTLLTISESDPYLVAPFAVQVLPTFMRLCEDEDSLVAMLTAFGAAFRVRYERGINEYAYNNIDIREYFLEVFQRINTDLEGASSSLMDLMQDELRRHPESQTDTRFEQPDYYGVRPSPLESAAGQELQGTYDAPADMNPDLVPNTTPGRGEYRLLPQFRVNSGSTRFHLQLDRGIEGDERRRMRSGVPRRFRINEVSTSAVLRALGQMFGQMPTNYDDRLLSHEGAVSGSYRYGSNQNESGDQEANEYGLNGEYRGRGITGSAGAGVVYTGSNRQDGNGNLTSGHDNLSAYGNASRVGNEDYSVQRLLLRLGFERDQGVPPVTPGDTEVPTEAVSQNMRIQARLDHFATIARERHTDMLVYLDDDSLLTDANGDEIDVHEGTRLRGRLCFLTADGDVIYQAATRMDPAEIFNYLYTGVNDHRGLGSTRFVGSQMFTSDSALAGFDGAAIGFEIPSGSFAALALGRLARNVNTMDPVYAEQALGLVWRWAVREAGRQGTDTLAILYRGRETVSAGPELQEGEEGEREPLDNDATEHQRTTGEVVWRRVGRGTTDSFEVRALAGGMPFTIMGRYRQEIRREGSPRHTIGMGAEGGYTGVDMLDQYREYQTPAEQLAQSEGNMAEADEIYSEMRMALVNLYGYSDDQARRVGGLGAVSFMYGGLEDHVVSNIVAGDDQAPADSTARSESSIYPSFLAMYWARSHHFTIGVQRAPGFANAFNNASRRMDAARRRMETLSPSDNTAERRAEIYQGVIDELRNDMQRDLWRGVLAYGWDGQNVRVYLAGNVEVSVRSPNVELPAATVGPNGETQEDSPYRAGGGAYGAVYFGDPTLVYVDAGARFFNLAPTTISVNSDGETVVSRGGIEPYADVTAGLGWNSHSGRIRDVMIDIPGQAHVGSALRLAYRLWNANGGRARIEQAYGEEFVAAFENELDEQSVQNIIVRPIIELEREVERRREQRDTRGNTELLYMIDIIEGSQTNAGTNRQQMSAHDIAVILREAYIAVRTGGDVEARIRGQYVVGREGERVDLLDVMATYDYRLDWMLASEANIETEFNRRSETNGTPEYRIAQEHMRPPPAEEQLTRNELQGMIQQNARGILERLYVAAGMESTQSARENYRVVFDRNLELQDPDERSNVYYIRLVDPTTESGSQGSIIIGNDDDRRQWVHDGGVLGQDILRITINRNETDYRLRFTGSRYTSGFRRGRLTGGVTFALNPELETYQTDRNWHVHGVLELLRSNNHQLFAAFNYVTREFGAEMVEDNEEESHLGPSERWDRTQIAFSYRFQQMLNGDTRDEVTAYVFYNRIQNRMEFATEEDFVRIQADTGGAGLTWTRVRISRGDQISLNFFIEAGQLQRRPRHEDETEIDPLFRTGLGFEYTQLRGRSGTPRTFGMDVSLEHGNWMSIPFPGDNVDPNMFGPFMEDALINGDPSAWTFMINARLNW